MGYTKLNRKKLKNRLRGQQKGQKIKELNAKPVIKNVDVQAIKESFRKGQGTKPEEATEAPAKKEEEGSAES